MQIKPSPEATVRYHRQKVKVNAEQNHRAADAVRWVAAAVTCLGPPSPQHHNATRIFGAPGKSSASGLLSV